MSATQQTTLNPDDYRVDEHGCWIWLRYADPNGYGRAYDRRARKMIWAHRLSYTLTKGPIPERHEIDHVCQQTLCVNPDHLDAVTKLEHARRTFQRLGRDDVHTAAASLRRSGMTYKEIAEALAFAGLGGAYGAVKAAIRKGLVSADDLPEIHRLNDAEREDIRILYAAGIPQSVIGRFYDIDSSQVSRICSGLTSGHGVRSA